MLVEYAIVQEAGEHGRRVQRDVAIFGCQCRRIEPQLTQARVHLLAMFASQYGHACAAGLDPFAQEGTDCLNERQIVVEELHVMS